jgi:hypothetical protein
MREKTFKRSKWKARPNQSAFYRQENHQADKYFEFVSLVI